MRSVVDDLRPVQSLGFEPSLAPPRLVTLAARHRRSPEGCFESGLAVRGGRCAAPPWRSAVRPWLKAAACELGRSRVPWSRCTLPVDIVIEPVAASAAPRERLERRSPHTSVLLPLSIPAASRLRIAPGPACRAPVAPPASDPTPRVAPGADPTIPPTAPVVSLDSSMNPFDLLRPRGLPIRVRLVRAAFTATRSRGSRGRHLAARRPRCLGRSPLERSAAAARWPDACAPVATCLRADAVTANNTAEAARPSTSEMGASAWP